jgi:uncharacterized protein with ParB-like and HNH nuclease domain
VAPVFQREANAWSLAKKQDFIANVLNGKMKSLGHFIILNKRETGKYSLLDGQHRLTTIQKFINGEFTIKLAGRKKAT